MDWSFNQREPVFIQISWKIKRDILSGKYPPGSQIPAVRQLAFEASVNPNTMQRALAALEAEGLLYTKNTQGRFVTEDIAMLSSASAEVKKETIERLLNEALELGVSPEEIINYLKEKNDG